MSKLNPGVGGKIVASDDVVLKGTTALTQTYATADTTHAALTAAALTVADGAGTNDATIGAITDNASTIAAVQELADQHNKLLVDVTDLKQFVNSIADILQAAGLAT